MKQFIVPILPIRVERDTDSKMQSYDVPGIELEYIPGRTAGRSLFTGAFFAGGTDGLAVSFCAEIPHAKDFAQKQYDSYTPHGIAAQRNEAPAGFSARKRAYKDTVFEDDCLELFIRPAGSAVYYGWEINAAGACLDYRAGIGAGGLRQMSGTAETKTAPAAQTAPAAAGNSAENAISVHGETLPNDRCVRGCGTDSIAGTDIHFDYDWQSRAQWRMQCEDEFWYTELFVPWSDFGLSEPPQDGSTWFGTINRIDAGISGKPYGAGVQGLQCLLDFDGTAEPLPRFHQPARFASFIWRRLPKKNTGGTAR